MTKLIDTWQIADIGSIAVESSDRARYTRITLKRDGAVKLTVPSRCLSTRPDNSCIRGSAGLNAIGGISAGWRKPRS